MIVTCCGYFISILGINLLVPKLNTEKNTQSLRQSMNSIKADESVFISFLKLESFIIYNLNLCVMKLKKISLRNTSDILTDNEMKRFTGGSGNCAVICLYGSDGGFLMRPI